MKYLVVENGWEYDDNVYSPTEGYTAKTIYSDKKVAEEAAKTLNYEKVFNSYGNGEIGPQYFQFDDWVEYDCYVADLAAYLKEKGIPFKDLYSFKLPKGSKKELVLDVLSKLNISFYHVVEVEEG